MFGDKIPANLIDDPKKLDMIFKILKLMFKLFLTLKKIWTYKY